VKRATAIEAVVFCVLVAVGVLSRVTFLTPPNFHAVAAAALFAGFFFRSGVVALAVPTVSMMISDAMIGGHAPLVMATVYAALAAPVAWRVLLQKKLTVTRVGLGAVSASVLFFVTTNLAAWPTLYPLTTAGLAHAYTAAIPFFQWTLAGDLCYSALFFGTYALAVKLAPARMMQPAAVLPLSQATADVAAAV